MHGAREGPFLCAAVMPSSLAKLEAVCTFVFYLSAPGTAQILSFPLQLKGSDRDPVLATTVVGQEVVC